MGATLLKHLNENKKNLNKIQGGKIIALKYQKNYVSSFKITVNQM